MQRAPDRSWAHRIGELPAAPVVGGSYLLILVLSLLLPPGPGVVVGLTLFVVFSAYVSLRTTRQGAVFGAWLAPAAFSGLAEAVAGVPRWSVAVPLVVLVVAALAHGDREERSAPAAA